MKERPILFSGPMVRAILDGRKTQTRRVMRTQPSREWQPASYDEVHKMVGGEFVMRHGLPVTIGWGPSNDDGDEAYPSPYGRPGDRLWVRESVRITSVADDDGAPLCVPPVWYEADGECASPDGYRHVRPSIHMPRWASRLTLEVVSVRVERLQDITGEDAVAEGLQHRPGPFGTMYDCGPLPLGGYGESNDPREAFAYLWDSINGKKPGRSWADNCWVWVIEFKRVET